MENMRVIIQTINCSITDEPKKKVKSRFIKFNKYFTRIIQTGVLFRKDSQDKKKGYHCELILSKKDNNLFTIAKAGNAEKAVTGAFEGMRKRLRKMKMKKQRKYRLSGLLLSDQLQTAEEA